MHKAGLSRTIIVTMNDPQPIRTPRSLAEAEALSTLTQRMQAMRSLAQHETIGVVMPIIQLIALDVIIAAHEESIGVLREQAKSVQEGAVNLDDARTLLDSLVAQVGAATDWLEIAMYCPRLPRFNEKGPLFSEQLSVDRRGGVLAFIDRYVKEALDLIKQLKSLADSGRFADPSAIDLELGNYEVELNCAKASALSAVINAVRSPVTVPIEIQETALSRLHNIIRWPRFAELPPGTRISVLTSIARLANGLGHEDVSKTALTKAHEIGPTDTDSAIHSIRNLLLFSTPTETTYFVNQLIDLASNEDIGAPFSRRRLGRHSVLRDTFSRVICDADETTEEGVKGIRAALIGQYAWTYGRHPDFVHVVHIVTDWQGNGRVIWEGNDGLEVRRFSVSNEKVMRAIQVSENRAGSIVALKAANAIFKEPMEPIMSEVLSDGSRWSLSGIGLAGLPPSLSSDAYGASKESPSAISHMHPLHGALPASDLRGLLPDLLIVDECFSSQSRDVVNAFLSAHNAQSTIGRVIRFNSKDAVRSIDRDDLFNALSSSKWPMYFGHSVSSITAAAFAGLVLGMNDILSIGELAGINLGHLDGLILISCASGRHNPIFGGVSVAHAAALAGAGEVVFSSWPLTPGQGARFAAALMSGYASGNTSSEIIAAYFLANPTLVGLFGLMQP